MTTDHKARAAKLREWIENANRNEGVFADGSGWAVSKSFLASEAADLHDRVADLESILSEIRDFDWGAGENVDADTAASHFSNVIVWMKKIARLVLEAKYGRS